MAAARIAIVDDEADALELFQFFLTSEGYAASSFGGGLEFLRTFGAGSFDLILLDISMPEVDGYALFTKIREIDGKVPMMAVTANAFDHDLAKLKAHGFQCVTTKPILRFDEFARMIRACLTDGRGS